ncbi:helix-turn-helix domain-containing protein [Sphingobacterium siyangense]|jgi:transcriptional regulator with XRE-family HTH domain|uniref:helix-turn-helix domain-containing protein n=1 Tax=Sphingobacterium siyangense TaxID=459529 RepID=UPI00301893DF
MNKLQSLREKLNLTQEELAQKSSISVRTIQRIEAGQSPKGYTLRALAQALNVDESEFSAYDMPAESENLTWIKIINLSSLPFSILPPLNVLVPIAIMLFKKQHSYKVRQLISIQIVSTLIAVLLMLVIFILNDWLGVKSNVKLLIPLCWILMNIIVILRNAIGLNKGENSRILPDISIL